jgi:hypothetical protein
MRTKVPGTGLEPVRPRGQRGLSSPCLHSTIRARPWAPHRGSEPIGTHPPNSSRAGRCCLILLTSEGASASGRRHPHLPTALRATARGACGMTEFHRPNKGAPPVLRLFSGCSPVTSLPVPAGGVVDQSVVASGALGCAGAQSGRASAWISPMLVLLQHSAGMPRRARTEWLPTSSAPTLGRRPAIWCCPPTMPIEARGFASVTPRRLWW